MWKVHLSKWVNCHIFGGSPNEMLSSRCMREKRITAVSWIDWLAFWHEDHCWRCYQWQLEQGDYECNDKLSLTLVPTPSAYVQPASKSSPSGLNTRTAETPVTNLTVTGGKTRS